MLIQKVLTKIDTQYVTYLRNRITGQGMEDILALVIYLFNLYGKITPQKLCTKIKDVKEMEYHISEPTNTVFNAIEDLIGVDKLAGNPYLATQIVNIGYIILSNNRNIPRQHSKMIVLPSCQPNVATPKKSTRFIRSYATQTRP